MKTPLGIAIILLFATPVLAQKSAMRQQLIPGFLQQHQSVMISGKISFSGNEQLPEKNIADYFRQTLPALQQEGTGLQLLQKTESRVGYHFTFAQTLHGCIVFGSQLKVNTDKQYRLLSAFDGLFELPGVAEQPTPGCMVFFDGEKVQMAWPDNNDHFTVLKSGKGEILFREDMNKYNMPPDTQVQAMVFMPDPLTSAQVPYASPYIDSNDADVPVLNAQRKNVNMRVTLVNDTFRLVNKYFKFTEFSDPVTVPAFSVLPAFSFTRAQQEFEDVNAFYHLNQFHYHIDSLGYDYLVNDTMLVDAHALGSSDLSQFSDYNGRPALFYGEGGVDDAEDPDVIVHEYTHSIIGKATVTIGESNERKAIDEAICDFFAISYSKRISSYNWEKIFNWDGNNASIGWYGRSAATTKTYPYNNANDYYWNSEILSGALADMADRMGNVAVEELLLAAISSMPANCTMKQLSALMLQSDSLLHNKQHYFPVQLSFFDRKIIDQMTGVQNAPASALFKIFNSLAFASGSGAVKITPALPGSVEAQIYDMSGRLLHTTRTENGDLFVSPAGFAPGTYLLLLRQGDQVYRTRLARY